MNMKDLKWYEAPASEVVELEMSQIICASPAGGGSEDIEDDKIDDGFFD
jgi:hypothetical protein